MKEFHCGFALHHTSDRSYVLCYWIIIYFQLKIQLTIFKELNKILIFLLAVQQEFQTTT